MLCFLVLYSLILLQSIDDDGIIFLGNSVQSFTQNLIYPVFEYLTWLFPISCFLATIFTVCSLSKNNELKTMDASGISFVFIARPILLLASICCVLCWFSKDNRIILNFIDRSFNWSPYLKSENAEFFQMKLGSENRTWYFKKYDKENKTADGVYLYSYDDNGYDQYRIKAETGKFNLHGWELKKGSFLGFSTENGVPIIKNEIMQWKPSSLFVQDNNFTNNFRPSFKKDFKTLKLLGIDDNPLPYALMRSRPKDIPIGDLNEIVNEFENSNSAIVHPYRLRRAQIFWNAPACLFASFFALAISFNRQRISLGSILGNSLIWIIFFYIIKTISDSLGEKGIVNEWQATGTPFVLLLLCSLIVIFRKR